MMVWIAFLFWFNLVNMVLLSILVMPNDLIFKQAIGQYLSTPDVVHNQVSFVIG